jgi:hypothetical protein
MWVISAKSIIVDRLYLKIKFEYFKDCAELFISFKNNIECDVCID